MYKMHNYFIELLPNSHKPLNVQHLKNKQRIQKGRDPIMFGATILVIITNLTINKVCYLQNIIIIPIEFQV